MIELPSKPSPNSMQITPMDFGFTQRGAASLRVDRLGNRTTMTFGYPPMRPAEAASFLSRLKRAKRQGLRIYLPLLVPQGLPGTPVVDGANQAGTTLNMRGLTPGYIVREDYWFTVVDADGVGYLHSVFQTVVASDTGTASVQIEPPLRHPFADGATIHLAKPFIEGLTEGGPTTVPSNKFIELSVTVEESQ